MLTLRLCFSSYLSVGYLAYVLVVWLRSMSLFYYLSVLLIYKVPEIQDEDEDIAIIDYGVYLPMLLAGEQINNARVNQDLLAARELRINIVYINGILDLTFEL